MISTTRMTCSACGTVHEELLPARRRQRRYYVCTACHSVLKAARDDCCVYCAFGDVPCLGAQARADIERELAQREQDGKRKVE